MATPENDSFITLHRNSTGWEWYTDGNTVRLFIHLLLLANHKQTKWRGETIERGQVLTGLDQLSRDLRLSVQKIRTALEHLISTGEVTNRSTNKYRVITINNYASYQDKKQARQQAGKQADEHSNNNQVTASNNDNNDNKKRDSYESLPSNFQSSEYRDESIRFSEWWANELKPGTIKDNRTNRAKWAHVWFHLRETDGRANGAEMCEAISWARSEPFWSTNFLSPMKLRDKDKNGVMYIDRFLEQYRKQKEGGLSNGTRQRGLTAGKLGRLADLINSSHSSIPA
ncbi:MAG: hypothetical protein HGA87_05330 [Desulfobulbaceae bacterium]|nr:hypothetical protein [Desulfobulbaceae bacterium]